MSTRPTYADYSALIDYLDERATSITVPPDEGARCYDWAEKLREDLMGLDPTSPLRPDLEEEDEGDDDGPFEDPNEEDADLYTEMRDLVSDALQIVTGTIKDEAERLSWIADARAALGEDPQPLQPVEFRPRPG